MAVAWPGYPTQQQVRRLIRMTQMEMQPLWQVAPLLGARNFSEAQKILMDSVRKLETDGIEILDLAPLREATLSTLRLLPRLAAMVQVQQQLGFAALGLVASVASKASEKPEQWKKYRGYILEAISFAATAWHSQSALVNQHVDNNRFLLKLCMIVTEKERSVRHQLCELVGKCVTAPLAQFWFARFFTSNLQGLLVVFIYGSTFENGAPARIVQTLMRQCHREFTLELLERVLMFVEAWSTRIPSHKPFATAWVAAAQSLLKGADDVATVALTPVAYFVVFFASARKWHSSRTAFELPDLVVAWLRAGLQAKQSGQDALALQGCVASKLMELAANPFSGECDALVCPLQRLICEMLLPSWLLGYSPEELAGHRGSAITRTLPAIAIALGKCLEHIGEKDQVELAMRPIELLSHEWCSRWCALSEAEQANATRKFFGNVLFFFISTILRSSDLTKLSSEALILAVQSLSHVEVFKEEANDTQEHRALCLSIVQQGAENESFLQSVLEMPAKLYTQKSCAEHSNDAFPSVVRLYFLLGLLACPPIIDSEHFFSRIWPVLVDCVSAVVRGANDSWTDLQLALRAHGLACVCFQHAGTSGREQLVKEYSVAAIEAFAAASNDDHCRALLSSVLAASQDVAARSCEVEVGSPVHELQRWLLNELGCKALDNIRMQHPETAEGLFKVLCGAACHVDSSQMPAPFYENCKLQSLLDAHKPLREVWLQSLVSNFPEKSREILIFCFLRDFPDSAAAFEAPMPVASHEYKKPWIRSLREFFYPPHSAL